MIRIVLSVAALVLALSVAFAQEDAIKTRKELMKANGDHAKILSDMSKGDKPYDQAAVNKAFAQFQEAAAKMPNLYPENTKSEAGSPAADEFSPSPKVWENMADFKSRFVKFGEEAKSTGAKVKDVDSLKAALGPFGKNNCGGCHETYRVKKG
jgi:cytochrome c556